MLKSRGGECTTHFCPREPGTSLTFTCIKSECPAQARMGVRGSNAWCNNNVNSCDDITEIIIAFGSKTAAV